jgi:hypothetical protein
MDDRSDHYRDVLCALIQRYRVTWQAHQAAYSELQANSTKLSQTMWTLEKPYVIAFRRDSRDYSGLFESRSRLMDEGRMCVEGSQPTAHGSASAGKTTDG